MHKASSIRTIKEPPPKPRDQLCLPDAPCHIYHYICENLSLHLLQFDKHDIYTITYAKTIMHKASSIITIRRDLETHRI